MKKKILIIMSCVAALILVTVLVVGLYSFNQSHPSHWRYNDDFIIGSTKDEIIEKYGEFDGQKGSSGRVKSYMIRDNTPEMVMSIDNSLWYDITFNEDGVAVKVELREGYIGG